jgi:hypothetical protein
MSTKRVMTKRVLLASGATLALASAARPQGQPQGSNQAEDVLLDHQAFHLTPDGRTRKILKMSEAGSTAVKRYGQEMAGTGHAMLYREGGKNYVLHDQKMADGSMLFDRAGEWESRS